MTRPWIFIAVLLAAAVHIVSVLLMPNLAPQDAFARLSRGGAANTFRTLPQVLPGREVAPYSDPMLATGTCVYDLRNGPLRVYASVRNGGFLSLSFHSRHDSVFYAMTDKAATRRTFDVVVATQAQLEALKAKDDPDEPPQELRLLSPEREGFVYARSLLSDPTDRRDAEQQIKDVRCEIDTEAIR